MSPTQPGVTLGGPVSRAERAIAPDLARGLMLLLIALAYAPTYLTNVDDGFWLRPGGGSTVDNAVNFASLLLLDNRAYPLFAALFGYGMAVLVSRQLAAGTAESEVRMRLRRRSLALLLFGFVHGALIYPGEILGPYAVAGLLIGWLLFRDNRTLVKAVAAIAPIYLVTIPVIGVMMRSGGEFGENSLGTYPETVLMQAAAYPFALVFNVVFFPIVLAILLGAWAGKRALLHRPAEHSRSLGRIATVGIGVSLAGALPAALIGAELWHPGATAGTVLLSLHIATGVFGGFGYAALFGLLGARLQHSSGVLVRSLTATGQRSLTCYLLQSALIFVVMSPVALDVGGPVHATGAALVAVAAWLAGVALSVLLERAQRRGPADALLRHLIYRDRAST
ncbi:DUF418 domain-containing protein [Haloechinothrix sp. LS1_15]|uniref:DUF418 domain-containing protein n=1 Tax=Haloechinothrix sp. LS1_15 TaxID=2652248 RepID=UPI0029446397|nr:DUF418 domain-containing protein [Haloechinothrix sp. LS1_15]MDV6010935.1 DUF418 domain-containing protein [Haloechinothrix sp. LS1_15]